MFAAWIARSKYHLPIEIFTINYDLILESALETLGVPYFDGFIGVLKARFQTNLPVAGNDVVTGILGEPATCHCEGCCGCLPLGP